MIRRWLAYPKIHTDELFSSWLIRVAHEFGCDPIDLTSSLWPNFRAWTIDIDRQIDAEKLSILLALINEKDVYFNNSFLKQHFNHVSNKLHSNANWSWVIPHGIRNRRQITGIQFCPMCLSTDKNPYFRLNWRIAWYTCCEKHKVNLIEKCEKCNLPHQPHRVEVINGNNYVCFNCGFNLKLSNTEASSELNALIQQKCDVMINYKKCFNWGVNSIQWFKLFRLFISLISRHAGNRKSNLIKFFSLYEIDILKMKKSSTGLAFEMLPLNERKILLSSAWKIFDRSYDDLKVNIETCNVPITTFDLRKNEFPKLLLEVFNLDKLPEKRIKSNKLIYKNKPNSEKVVLRMYARLKRKIS